MAGYRGSCVSADTEATSGSVIDFDRQTVRGVEGNGTNSDKLSVLKAEEWDMSNPVRIIGFTSSAAPNTVQLTRPIHTKETEMLLVSDCHQLAAFYPECTDMTDCSSVKPKTAISFKDYVLPENCIQSDTESCPHLYTLGTENGMTYSVEEIGKLEGINDNNRRKGSDNRQLFALYRNDVEMVEGVENLQILYGLENNAQTQYCDAKQLEDSSACPGNITHIRISMVVASSNNVHSVSESQSFDILNHGSDGTLTKNDRRLRRVFTTTIQLRNKR
ncbi:PilW family protein [Endozoicomonas acroporae]|uniref:PilW family protein n=1 Tax=Endozoicomonas acroporae TaxID=1701104 RepID=UPI003D7AE78D